MDVVKCMYANILPSKYKILLDRMNLNNWGDFTPPPLSIPLLQAFLLLIFLDSILDFGSEQSQRKSATQFKGQICTIGQERGVGEMPRMRLI